MRQEARFLLAITLMILVLVATPYLFPTIPPEELSGPAGEGPGQVDGTGVTGAPTIPLGGAAPGGGVADDEPGPLPVQPGAAPSPIFPAEEVPPPPRRGYGRGRGPPLPVDVEYGWSPHDFGAVVGISIVRS